MALSKSPVPGRQVVRHGAPNNDGDDVAQQFEDPPVVALTAEQARELRQRQRPLSPWHVVAWQAAGGALLAGLIALFGDEPCAPGLSIVWRSSL